VVCADNALLLHAYLDGELDLVRSLEIEEHMKTCGRCAQELRNQEILRKAIRSASVYQRAPEGLRGRIIASLEEATPRASALGRGGASPVHTVRRRQLLEWLAIAAAIVVAVALGMRIIPGVMNARQGDLVAQELIASHIRSLQPGHLLDVASTDQHTVKPWFDGKVDFSPPVRDLADQGYPLIGGRLDYIGKRDVAALVYQLRKHYINVFVWPDDAKPMGLPTFVSAQGYNLMCWSSSGMRLCAVSDANADDLRGFVRLLQR
jgi:anti-sigma factor RsiW